MESVEILTLNWQFIDFDFGLNSENIFDDFVSMKNFLLYNELDEVLN